MMHLFSYKYLALNLSLRDSIFRWRLKARGKERKIGSPRCEDTCIDEEFSAKQARNVHRLRSCSMRLVEICAYFGPSREDEKGLSHEKGDVSARKDEEGKRVEGPGRDEGEIGIVFEECHVIIGRHSIVRFDGRWRHLPPRLSLSLSLSRSSIITTAGLNVDISQFLYLEIIPICQV